MICVNRMTFSISRIRGFFRDKVKSNPNLKVDSASPKQRILRC
uniref:Uncharacterized protein n=1 Tax=Lepeophtheirus salmonis TaxID=72036 RepID=A0A0K2TYU7_LEPSM